MPPSGSVSSLTAPYVFCFWHCLDPQIFCVMLWCLDEYWYYSIFTLIMLVIFESTVVMQRQKSLDMLRNMRRPPHAVFVFRQRVWIEMQSYDLLPGDVISLSNTTAAGEHDRVCPCDVMLLQGSCVVNESMLTGESVPQKKESLVVASRNEDQGSATVLCVSEGTDKRHRKHMVFGGTKIMQVLKGEVVGQVVNAIPRSPDGGCIAFVMKTGFSTTQGSLMRTILFTTERISAHSAETFYFILVLLVFAIIAALFVLREGLADPDRSRFKLLLHCIMVVTSVVPPELPMELSLAVNNSLIALLKFAIYCTEPFRIPFAGAVNICCFDKTGTLTSDDLTMLGVAGLGLDASGSAASSTEGVGDARDALQPSVQSGLVHTGLTDNAHLPERTQWVLAACHGLVTLEGGRTEGDPTEKAALEGIGWTVSSHDLCTPPAPSFEMARLPGQPFMKMGSLTEAG
jgi:cation-transporting ATPase 13A1